MRPSELPIDVVPSVHSRARFRWKQIVHTPVGSRTVDHEGSLLPTVEGALLRLIAMVKQQQTEIESLKKQIEGHCERIAKQSDQLSKVAESGTKQTAKKG